MVAGVLVAANCRVALPVFGFLFLLAGAVLTAAAYRGPETDEEPNTYFERVELTGNSRILGPACLVVGTLMMLAGVLLCSLNRRARKQERQRRVGFHCPIHGDFYPTHVKDELLDEERGLSSCWKGNREDDEEELGPRARANSVIAGQAPLCPHSSHTSARSSLCSPWTQQQQVNPVLEVSASVSPNVLSRCPTPQPFLVPSGSISSGMVPSLGQRLSPDQTFGSIRSLSVSREVASFPMCVMAEIPTPTVVPSIPPPRPPPPGNSVRLVAPACEAAVVAG
ncbi:hypothetical protein B566_EDAN010939 [Ephemera danica]|nr:hypothetical protein B566_EDAN010939 [Ephemera danica]